MRSLLGPQPATGHGARIGRLDQVMDKVILEKVTFPWCHAMVSINPWQVGRRRLVLIKRRCPTLRK